MSRGTKLQRMEEDVTNPRLLLTQTQHLGEGTSKTKVVMHLV